MKVVYFDGLLKVCHRDKARRKNGEVLIRVETAGICNTDHEIIRGYIPGFKGILGHEFFGYVEDADDKSIIGKRVTAEINIVCGKCEFCSKGIGTHCSNRKVIGIINKDGAMAEYITVPNENIVEIPPSIPDAQAIFIEPLAAALEILEQISIDKNHSVLLIGDGKLALLIAMVVYNTGCALTIVGKHSHKVAILKDMDIKTTLLDDFQPEKHDIVIEASGNPSAFELGLACVKPRGTFILKSTYSDRFPFNPSSIVVDEITLVGSRCGRFNRSIDYLQEYNPEMKEMISKEYHLDDAIEAFNYSARPDTLKVLIKID